MWQGNSWLWNCTWYFAGRLLSGDGEGMTWINSHAPCKTSAVDANPSLDLTQSPLPWSIPILNTVHQAANSTLILHSCLPTSMGLYHWSLPPSAMKSSGYSSFWFVQFSTEIPTAFLGGQGYLRASRVYNYYSIGNRFKKYQILSSFWLVRFFPEIATGCQQIWEVEST